MFRFTPTLALTAMLLLLGYAPRPARAVNSTASWLAKRAALINDVFGYGPGVLSNKSLPDAVLQWPEDAAIGTPPGLQGLVWDLSMSADPERQFFFDINSTVFYAPVKPGERTKHAFFFHHGHSNCVCDRGAGEPVLAGSRCRPGCVGSPSARSESRHDIAAGPLLTSPALFRYSPILHRAELLDALR